jgi:hypothetical protein
MESTFRGAPFTLTLKRTLQARRAESNTLIVKLITDEKNRLTEFVVVTEFLRGKLERQRSLRVGFRRWFGRPAQIQE